MLLICILSLLVVNGMTLAGDFSPSPEDDKVCIYSAPERSTSIQPLLGTRRIYGSFDDIATKRLDGKQKKKNLYQKKIKHLLIGVSTSATPSCVYGPLVELQYMPQNQVVTPKSFNGAQERIHYTVTGTTIFLDDKQQMRTDRIFSYSNYLSLALLLATPPLLDLIYCDYSDGASEEKIVDHAYVNKVYVNILVNFVTTISINSISRLYLSYF